MMSCCPHCCAGLNSFDFMKDTIYLKDMFPDFEPPETLQMALSQAAIAAADIHPESRSVHVALHSDNYIPRRLLDQVTRGISRLYGLESLQLTVTCPADQLEKIEPEELMQLFVEENSMTRGSLAGAQWQWEDTHLHIRLKGNGKATVEEAIPKIQTALRERFAAPVTIDVEAGADLEGQALFDAMETMRDQLMDKLPAMEAQAQAKAAPKTPVFSDTFYGKSFRGTAVPMDQLTLDMGTIIVEGRVFNIDHKELKKRNAYVVKFEQPRLHPNHPLHGGRGGKAHPGKREGRRCASDSGQAGGRSV